MQYFILKRTNTIAHTRTNKPLPKHAHIQHNTLDVFRFLVCCFFVLWRLFYIKQSLSSGLQHLSNNDFLCVLVLKVWEIRKASTSSNEIGWNTRHVLILCVLQSKQTANHEKMHLLNGTLSRFMNMGCRLLLLRSKYSNFIYSSGTLFLGCHTLSQPRHEIKCVESFFLCYGFNVSISLYLCHRMRVKRNRDLLAQESGSVQSIYPDENALLAIQWRGYDLNT